MAYGSDAEDEGLSAADQDPGTAGGDTSEDGAVSDMYSNFAAIQPTWLSSPNTNC